MAALVSTSPDPTADRLARSVLTRRLNLRPKENVTIEAYPSSLRWATGFVREARRLGARPVLHYEDEASYWQAVDTGKAALLGAPGEHEWAALENTDVYIYFWGPEDTARRDRLPDRVQSQLTAFNGRWYEVAKKSGVRGARMTIARVTEANARRWGVSPRAWMNEVMAASLRDPATLRRDAERVRRALANGRSLRLTHPNGTDLTLALAKRPVHVTIGEVTPASLKAPFGMMANVPDGCVYVAVDESTADGTFVANRPTARNGSALRGGRWTFENGRLREFQFSEGGAKFGSEYRSAAPGKDRPALIEVGLDPSVRYAPMLEEAEAGAVTVGVGRNVGFGGKTKGDFLAYITLGGGELSVDGRPLVRRGKVVSG